MSDGHAGHGHAEAPKKGGPVPLLAWLGIAFFVLMLARGCSRDSGKSRAALPPHGNDADSKVESGEPQIRGTAKGSSTDDFIAHVLHTDATRQAVNGLAEFVAGKEHYIRLNELWQVDPVDRTPLKRVLVKLKDGVPINVELTKIGEGKWRVASAEEHNGKWVEVPDVWESKAATDSVWRRSWVDEDWKSGSGGEIPLFPIFQLRLPVGSLKEGMTPYVIISLQ